MGLFPADQDLASGDTSIATVIRSTDSGGDAKRVVQKLREAYPGETDLVVIAVPAGKAAPFLEGLQMALERRGQLQGTIDLNEED